MVFQLEKGCATRKYIYDTRPDRGAEPNWGRSGHSGCPCDISNSHTAGGP